jgi:hypothetical protein
MNSMISGFSGQAALPAGSCRRIGLFPQNEKRDGCLGYISKGVPVKKLCRLS